MDNVNYDVPVYRKVLARQMTYVLMDLLNLTLCHINAFLSFWTREYLTPVIAVAE